MKKFQFNLQPVLEQRNQREQQALLHQSRVEQLYRERLALLEKSQHSLSSCLNMTAKNPLMEMQRLLYQDHLRIQIHHQSQQVHQAKNNLDQACQKTMQARQERMVLEKLKEKKHEQYTQHIRLQEAKQTDEMATMLYNRKNSQLN